MIDIGKKKPNSLPPQALGTISIKLSAVTFKTKIFVIGKKLQKVMRLGWFPLFALLVTGYSNIQLPSNMPEGSNISINITAVNIEGISVNSNIK